MVQTLADMLDNAPTGFQKGFVWLRVLLDLPLSISQQQLSYIGTTLGHETPEFVRWSGFISGLLLLPFFVIVIFNDATAHGLYHTWLWGFGALLTWIIILPALGFLLSTATLLLWLIQNKKQQQRSWLQSLSDIRHNWPMTIFILLGAGILALVFFHDSVHCVIGDPITELYNWHETWRCIQQR